MNPTTIELLRAATIQALQNKHDVAAVELLSLMDISNAPPVKALPQAVTHTVIEGPAHEHEYWSTYIRQKFIPFMKENGRYRFTSYELIKWLDRRDDLSLTTGDIEKDSRDRFVWRDAVSYAIGNLKSQGIINAPPHGKEYEICSTPQPKHDDPFRELNQMIADLPRTA